MRFTRAAGVAALAICFGASILASSHREAPEVTEVPKVDGTDFYIFQSFDPAVIADNDTTILISNFGPLQDPNGGPNYFFADEQAFYQIHVDNTGNAVEDITFRFRFDNAWAPHTVTVDNGTQVELPLILRPTATITTPFDPDLSAYETYRLDVIIGSGAGAQVHTAQNATSGGVVFVKPVDDLGRVTIPNYAAYSAQHVWSWNVPALPGAAGRVFVGQRDDPYHANFGSVFGVDFDPLPAGDRLLHNNVTSFAIEVPTGFLTNAGAVSIVGGWSTSMLQQTRQLNPSPTNPDNVEPPIPPGAPMAQVSRLGNPLVNTLLIGLGQKDRFNSSQPNGDLQFQQFFLNSSLAEVLGFPSSNRTDLRDMFLQGVGGLNQNGSTGEMLRLNVAIPPTPAAQQNELGALAPVPDPAGYPNGRRPADDVVDIVLKALSGDMNSPIGDGVRLDAADFPVVFPFLGVPTPQTADTDCVILTSSIAPDAGFQAVDGTFVDPSRPSELVAPLDPAPVLEFYLVETEGPTDVSIATMAREANRVRVFLQR